MCNALISACASAGQWHLALSLLEEMSRLAVRTSTVSYNAAAEACQKASSWAGAMHILGCMQKGTLQIDVITLSLVGSTCASTGQSQILQGLLSSMSAVSKVELPAQHAVTATEFLTEHARLSDHTIIVFARLEWKTLLKKFRELCACTFAPSTGEKTSRRLLDGQLNQYFTLGTTFVQRTLSIVLANGSHQSWSGLAHYHVRQWTAECMDADVGSALEDEASAQGLATWIQHSETLQTETGQTACRNAGFTGTFGYGNGGVSSLSWLLPVNVQHDRSRRGLSQGGDLQSVVIGLS